MVSFFSRHVKTLSLPITWNFCRSTKKKNMPKTNLQYTVIGFSRWLVVSFSKYPLEKIPLTYTPFFRFFLMNIYIWQRTLFKTELRDTFHRRTSSSQFVMCIWLFHDCEESRVNSIRTYI